MSFSLAIEHYWLQVFYKKKQNMRFFPNFLTHQKVQFIRKRLIKIKQKRQFFLDLNSQAFEDNHKVTSLQFTVSGGWQKFNYFTSEYMKWIQ